MWTIFYDCIIKVQKYTYSCFPCSLHMGLANLGYVKNPYRDEDDSVEIFFNKVCEMENKEDLNAAGPTSVEQLVDITILYLNRHNITLSQFNVFYTNKGLNAISIKHLLEWDKKKCYAAIIAKYEFMGHATLIIKDGDNFTYIHSSTDYNVIRASSDFGKNIKINPPNEKNHYSQIEFEGFSGIDNKNALIVTGDFLFIFESVQNIV